MLYQKKILSVTILAATLGIPSIHAQENGVYTLEDDEFLVVTGIRSSIRTSSRIKEDSSTIVDAISSEDLGKFPDANVAESLQRITGVAITRSRGGEGQYVSVRGLGEEFNNVTFNGRTLATESGGREFSFDVIASELISEAVIHKTSRASLGDGSIGGSINVKTARPFDKVGFRSAGSISGIQDSLADEDGYKFSGILSHTFAEDTWGVLASFSHSELDIRSDIVEGVNFFSVDVDENNNPLPSNNDLHAPGTSLAYDDARFSSLTVLKSQEERIRTSGTLVIQYQPNDDIDITFDTLYSHFESPTESVGLSFFPSVSDLIPGTIQVNDNNFVDSFSANTDVDLLSRARQNDTDTFQYGLNGKFQVQDNLSLEGDLSYSKAEGERNNTGSAGNSGTFFATKIPNGRGTTQARAFNVPSFSFQGPSANDPNTLVGVEALQADQIRSHFGRIWTNEISDEVIGLKLSGQLDLDEVTSFKFGLDYTQREKTTEVYNNLSPDTSCPEQNTTNANIGLCDAARTLASLDPEFESQNLTVDDFLSDINTDVPRNFPTVSTTELERLYGIYASTNGIDNPLATRLQRSSSNVLEEDILGAYVELNFAGDLAGLPWIANTGLRLVETTLTSAGHSTSIQSITRTGASDQRVELASDVPISVENSYFNVLPSFNFALNLNDDTVLRSAFSQTISRPTISDLSTAYTVTSTNIGTEAQTFGNPSLNPPKSNNVDLSIEWYGEDAFASAAIFYKELSDFVANINTTETLNIAYFDNYNNGVPVATPVDLGVQAVEFQTSRPENGDSAEILGLELAYQYIWANGLGILANMTLTDSSATVARMSNDFENISDESYNLSAFYEDGPWQVRVSLNHRSDYVETTIGLQGFTEVVDDFTQVDASINYELLDSVTLFVEGTNLTGEDFLKYSETPEALVTYEDREPRYSFGIRGSF